MIDRNHNGAIDPMKSTSRRRRRRASAAWDRDSLRPSIATRTASCRRGAAGRYPSPDIVYSERMQITLGGRTVDLVYPGLNHSDDATVMLFRNERVLFATEFLADALVTTSPRSLPSTCSAFDRHPLSEWIRSYRTVEALDFDRVAPGHGDVFDKAVVTETREYFEYLVAQVSAGIRSGRPLAELKETIMLDRYKTWANYERLRRMNVEAAYLNLTAQ
jgi:glyoxylase-like metal-dependent hydrolase (beta-lactamase superfamily II)